MTLDLNLLLGEITILSCLLLTKTFVVLLIFLISFKFYVNLGEMCRVRVIIAHLSLLLQGLESFTRIVCKLPVNPYAFGRVF